MNSLWVVAPAAIIVGAIPLAVATTRLTAELRALRGDLEDWASARPTLGSMSEEVDELVARVQALSDR
jgi:hypothetical protein